MSDKMKKTRSQAWQIQPIGRWLAEIRIHPRTVKLTLHTRPAARRSLALPVAKILVGRDSVEPVSAFWGETRSFAGKRLCETGISRKGGLRANNGAPAVRGKKCPRRPSAVQANRRSPFRSDDFPVELVERGCSARSLGRIPGRGLAERNRSNEWTRHRAREIPRWPESISAAASTGRCSRTETEKIAANDAGGKACMCGSKYPRTIFTFGKASTYFSYSVGPFPKPS